MPKRNIKQRMCLKSLKAKANIAAKVGSQLDMLPIHSQLEMLPIILEEVTPKNDDLLRLQREELWIRYYQSIEFGTNKILEPFFILF